LIRGCGRSKGLYASGLSISSLFRVHQPRQEAFQEDNQNITLSVDTDALREAKLENQEPVSNIGEKLTRKNNPNF
jgi:hypothetical protein